MGNRVIETTDAWNTDAKKRLRQLKFTKIKYLKRSTENLGINIFQSFQTDSQNVNKQKYNTLNGRGLFKNSQPGKVTEIK